MSSDLLLRRLLLLTFVLAALQASINAVELPALSAAWFDLRGRPVWFVPTTRLVLVHVGIVIALVIAFMVLPARLVRAPAGAGGLDPRRTALRQWTWFGLATLLFVAGLAQLVYDANRAALPQLDLRLLGLLLLAYAGFVAPWWWARRRASVGGGAAGP